MRKNKQYFSEMQGEQQSSPRVQASITHYGTRQFQEISLQTDAIGFPFLAADGVGLGQLLVGDDVLDAAVDARNHLVERVTEGVAQIGYRLLHT